MFFSYAKTWGVTCPRARRFRENKKAVLSQRWPRDALYISRSWGVAEIWPFEIIQEGGAILNLFESKIAPLDPPSPKTPPYITKHEVDRTTGWEDMAIWNFSKMAAAAILDLFELEIAPLDPPSSKIPPYNKTWRGSDDRSRRYRHLKFFQHGGGRHLGFVRIVNSAVRSDVPENPTLEPNMKWIGSPVAEIWPFAYVGGIWNPHFGGKGRS